MQRVLTNTSGGIAAALELVTANIANPTELNAIGTAVPDWRLVRTNVAGSDEATLYRLDTDTDAVNAPYIMASATAGLRWVAISGRYQLQAHATVSTVTAKPSTTAGIQLNPNAATGNFTGSLVPSNLTANRTWTFPDAAIIVSGSAAALTSGRVPFVTTGGVLIDNANFTYSTTVLNVANTTAASSSITGSVTIGNGSAATNVGIGGGAIFAGGKLTLSGGALSEIAAFNSTNAAGIYQLFQRSGGANILWGHYAAASGGSAMSADGLFLRSANGIGFGAASGTLDVAITTAGQLGVKATTAASSSITGALVVGDGATAATCVGIGGGNLYAGAGIHAAGSSTVGGDLTIGAGSGARYHIVNGGNSGASDGAAFLVRNGGANIFLFGNKSAILGGAYDATPYISGSGTLEINLNASMLGTLAVASTVTVGSTTLLTSSVALTNGAGAGAGTITNASAAGNPTKWVPIVDNGVTRYIPAW